MERLETSIGWPSTRMDDEFVMRSARYLASVGYRDDAIIAILAGDLGVDFTRSMRIVAAAKTDRIAASALQRALAGAVQRRCDDELPPAA